MQPARFRDMQPVSMGANKEVFVCVWGGGLQVKQAGGTQGLHGWRAVGAGLAAHAGLQLWDSRNFEAVLVDDIEGERLVPDGRCAAARGGACAAHLTAYFQDCVWVHFPEELSILEEHKMREGGKRQSYAAALRSAFHAPSIPGRTRW